MQGSVVGRCAQKKGGARQGGGCLPSAAWGSRGSRGTASRGPGRGDGAEQRRPAPPDVFHVQVGLEHDGAGIAQPLHNDWVGIAAPLVAQPVGHCGSR